MALVEKRYAEALVDLSVEQAAIEQYMGDLGSFAAAYREMPEFKAFLLNPEAEKPIKKDALRKIFGRSLRNEVLNFLMLLVDKDRIKHIPGIYDEFVKQADAKRNVLHIKIISASPLDSTQIERITGKYGAAYRSAAVKTDVEIDPGVIGGVKVIIGDKVIDGTVKGRLKALREELIKG